MKKFAAAKSQSLLKRIDDFLEAIGGQRSAIKQEKSEMAQHFARAGSGKDGVALYFGEDFSRVIVKNQMQEIAERVAVRHMRTEECRRAFAPCDLRGSSVAEKPALFAQDFSHIAGGESIHGDSWNRIRYVLRRHCEILSHARGIVGREEHYYR